MSQPSGLRKRIEKIGQDVLDKYCQRTVTTSGPIMIPPIPDSKFIDKLPEDMILQGQDGYEAEVKVFRYLEDVRRNVIVLHQLEYTHEQYSAFLPIHQCNKRNCKKQPENHDCHQPKTNVEGETDFLVLGHNFALVLEVKGALAAVQIQGCCEDGLRQRRRIVELIKSVNSNLPVYEFTVFSNISGDKVDEKFLSDETLMFSEDLEYFEEILDCCETYASIISKSVDFQTPDVKRCILGLWCIKQDNKWDSSDCSLSKCIRDVDEKLRKALVTRRSVDEAMKKESGKNKKTKEKKYLENPDMVEAPDIFKKHLNIRCLTKDQLELYRSKKRFLWVEGPAGTGKTIAILGKIIEIALNSTPDERILLILPRYSIMNPASKRHFQILNKDMNISCIEIVYDYWKFEGDFSEQLDKAHSSLSQQLSDSTNKIVLLSLDQCVVNSIHNVITRCFDYVFVDDFQTLCDKAICEVAICPNPSFALKSFIPDGLLRVVQNSLTNNTRMWILCDNGQSSFDKVIKLPVSALRLSPFIQIFQSFTDTAIQKSRDTFLNYKELTVNLRNTFEISTVISIIRKYRESMDYTGTSPETWPQQEGGHFLRGKKPVIYLVQTNETSTWREILVQELEILRGSDSRLRNRDIVVLVDEDTVATIATVRSVLSRWDITDDKITVLPILSCVSAEWAAVICIDCYDWSDAVTRPDFREDLNSACDLIPQLYISLSRARVYCTVILLDCRPNNNRYVQDKLLAELRLRNDVCKVIVR